MSKSIDNPKVFISYAWSSEEYREKVVSFAEKLINDGIDVVLDIWDLKEGYDIYSFMEQSVTDPSITNVLILLDPQYKEKSNIRNGGVGTETQIISPEIYKQVKQDKFLPIVFERGVNGEIPIPAYLKSIFYFDLSIPERYAETYQRLVNRLHGIETMRKPELRSKPALLGNDSISKINKAEKYSIEWLISEFNELMNKYDIFGFINVDPIIGMPERYPILIDSFYFELGQKLTQVNFLQQHPKFFVINSFREMIYDYTGYLAKKLFPANNMYTIQNPYDLIDISKKDSDIRNKICNYKEEIDKLYGQINENCSMFSVTQYL